MSPERRSTSGLETHRSDTQRQSLLCCYWSEVRSGLLPKFIEVVSVATGLVPAALHPIGLDLVSGHRGAGQLIPVCRVEGRSPLFTGFRFA